MLTYEEFTEEAKSSFDAEGIEYDPMFVENLWKKYRTGKITEKGKMRTDIDDIGEIQNIIKGYKYVKYGENSYDKDTDDILDTFEQRLTDVKHMSYYDVFLEEGASSDIQRALNKNGVPIDVLKGVRKTVDMSGEPQHVILEDGRNAVVRVYQEIERVDGESPTVVGFKVTIEYANGDTKTIYSWGTFEEEEDYESLYESEEPDVSTTAEGIITMERLEKKGFEFSKFSPYSLKAKINNGYQNSKTRGEVKVVDVKITYDKNGKVYVRDSKGRFVGVKK